ncbi:hypothetical protein GBA52_017282, partial [Prunus armeniaca]
VARGIRGWPRSMLRDMRRGLARGTGRANVAPAVASEVATSSQQSLVRGVGRGLPRTMIRGLEEEGQIYHCHSQLHPHKRAQIHLQLLSLPKSIFNFCHCPTWFHIQTSSY